MDKSPIHHDPYSTPRVKVFGFHIEEVKINYRKKKDFFNFNCYPNDNEVRH
jgi:hypothetical protein